MILAVNTNAKNTLFTVIIYDANRELRRASNFFWGKLDDRQMILYISNCNKIALGILAVGLIQLFEKYGKGEAGGDET